jgi:8-oxo-dGTP pyrophosphatase MutT (NUDIX family)
MKASVALILKDDRILLGLSTSPDARFGKWCFVGGMIDPGESPFEAVVREAREEAHVIVTARLGEAYKVDEKPEIAYIICDYQKGMPIPNDEFKELGWFNIHKLPINMLELNSRIIANLLK